MFNASYTMCIFDKAFASFWHLPHKNLHKNRSHINRHASFRFDMQCDLCGGIKTTRQLTLPKLKWHILLHMWHLRWFFKEKKLDVNLCSFSFLKMSHDTLDFKDERQMKFVKPTHCSYTTDEQRLFKSITLGHRTLWLSQGKCLESVDPDWSNF
jgi:hypothetical protein